MKPWNDTYANEAEQIAGSVVADWGERWAALQFFRGSRRASRDVAIAMRALMYARGEIDPENFRTTHDKLVFEDLRRKGVF